MHISSPDLVELTLYTTNRELLFPTDIWKKVGASSPDAPMTLTVEAIDAQGNLRTSTPRSRIVASDGIDESSIYVWQSSTGSFRVLDIIKGTDIALPTNSPQLSPGQPCSGCHRNLARWEAFLLFVQRRQFQFRRASLRRSAEALRLENRAQPISARHIRLV
jgi:hypothetical protein